MITTANTEKDQSLCNESHQTENKKKKDSFMLRQLRRTSTQRKQIKNPNLVL